jgi:hypothetical protein
MTLTGLERAGRWFLSSGIQEPDGGVARYRLSDSRRNARVSTEITGYAVSFLVWAHQETGDREYLDSALKAGRWLTRSAWDRASGTFPFEPVSNGEPAFSYFFDCGIIIRGLLALWRASGETEFLEKAQEAAVAMAFDFDAPVAVYPVIALPEKQPLACEPRWSRSPGCYQLKSALAWRDIAEATGHPGIAAAWERMLAYALSTHDEFLPGDPNPERVMDRLHAYAYFLEALLAAAPERPGCAAALAAGIERLGRYLGEIAPRFERSDVYAQLLRLRIYAHHLGVVPLDAGSAGREAAAIESFQSGDGDPLLEGGFWFGRKGAAFLPFMNPVSTAFCAQALRMWKQHLENRFHPRLALLV